MAEALPVHLLVCGGGRVVREQVRLLHHPHHHRVRTSKVTARPLWTDCGSPPPPLVVGFDNITELDGQYTTLRCLR